LWKHAGISLSYVDKYLVSQLVFSVSRFVLDRISNHVKKRCLGGPFDPEAPPPPYWLSGISSEGGPVGRLRQANNPLKDVLGGIYENVSVSFGPIGGALPFIAKVDGVRLAASGMTPYAILVLEQEDKPIKEEVARGWIDKTPNQGGFRRNLHGSFRLPLVAELSSSDTILHPAASFAESYRVGVGAIVFPI
jgi:hypothetical protein